MGIKTFPLIKLFNYQLNASVALLTFPIIFTINDVITEVYGKERTRSIIRSGLLMIIFLIIFSVFATWITPSSRFTSSEDAYDLVFHQSLRVSIASLIAFIGSELMDVLVFIKVRKKFGKNKLWLRINISNWISQFIDTSLFMTLAFYSIKTSTTDNFSFLIGLILPYWLLKCFMSVIETPLAYLTIKWLKK